MPHGSLSEKLANNLNYLLLALIAIVTVLPMLYVFMSSFSISPGWIPDQFTLNAYKYIFSTHVVFQGLGVSVFITVAGTFISLLFTSLMAYSLGEKHVPGRNMIMAFVIFTLLFSGGMIPTYFVVKATGLLNSLWALMIPSAISSFNLIILRNFFMNIPTELKESARIDGCNDLGILFRIVMPLSMPAMAAFGLFYAVAKWNMYFEALLYIQDSSKWPVQIFLRQIIFVSSGGFGDTSAVSEDAIARYSESIKMAVIVVATLPILLIYPFLQKHFAKGIMLGSVKG
jgi:putative aldouronate transport system permease protein